MSIAEKLITVAENEQKVYKAGKQAEYDRFWDIFQQNGNLDDYSYTFASKSWTVENFKPKYDMIPTSANTMFRNCPLQTDLQATLEELGVTLDFSKCTNFGYTFYISKFTRIGTVDTRGCTGSDLTLTFATCPFLHTIDKLILLEDGTTRINISTFQSSAQLRNITFEGLIGNTVSFAWQASLTDASVQSVIDHLKDLTGAAAQTLTLHATVGAKLTEAQKATITAKNWTLVY